MIKAHGTAEILISKNLTLYNPRLGRDIVPTKSNTGYLVFGGFNLKFKWSNFLFHRVVWQSFNGPIPKGLVINHKDGDKLNNSLNNLEVVTYAENNRHSRDVLGNNKGIRIFSHEDILKIKLFKDLGLTEYEIAQEFGVTQSAINGITRKNPRAYKEYSGIFHPDKI